MVRGVRGATTVEVNDEAVILAATQELLEQLIRENDIDPNDIASIFFSVTDDLDATFPAKSARAMGLNDVPLMCMTEIPVPEGLASCIRILIHLNTEKTAQDIVHIYLNGAEVLRPEHAKR